MSDSSEIEKRDVIFDKFAENAKRSNEEHRQRTNLAMEETRERSRKYFYEKVLPANGLG